MRQKLLHPSRLARLLACTSTLILALGLGSCQTSGLSDITGSIDEKVRHAVTKLADIVPLHPAGDQFDATSTDLKSALLRLSPDERLPLVLHFYLDLPLDEVARTLGLSPAATKSRIYRTARKLRSDLTLEEVF